MKPSELETIGKFHCGHYGPLIIGRLRVGDDGAWRLHCPDCAINDDPAFGDRPEVTRDVA